MLEAVDGSADGGGCGQVQNCGESSEEELSVLPRRTKVVVTGSNRTKSVLVGLHGVVKKAVGARRLALARKFPEKKSALLDRKYTVVLLVV